MVTTAVWTLMFFTLTTALHNDYVYRGRQRPTHLSSQLVQSLSDQRSQQRVPLVQNIQFPHRPVLHRPPRLPLVSGINRGTLPQLVQSLSGLSSQRVPLVQKTPFPHRPVLQRPPRLSLVSGINRGTLPQLRPVRSAVNFHARDRTYIIPASLLHSQSLHSQLNSPRHQVLVLTGNNVISLGSKSPTSPPRRNINQYFIASNNKLAVLRNLICNYPRNRGFPACGQNMVRSPTNPELGFSLQPVPFPLLAGLAHPSNGSPKVSTIPRVAKVTKQATPVPTSTSERNLNLPDGATLLSVLAQAGKQVSVEPIEAVSTSDRVAASLQTVPVSPDPAPLLSLALSSSNTTSLDSLSTGPEATQWINETVGVNDTEELSFTSHIEVVEELSMSSNASNKNSSFQGQTARLVNETVGGIDTEDLLSTSAIEAAEELSNSSDASNENSSFQANFLSVSVPENTTAFDSVHGDSKVDSLVNETATEDIDEQSSVSSTGSLSSDESSKDVYYLTDVSDEDKDRLRIMIDIINGYNSDS